MAALSSPASFPPIAGLADALAVSAGQSELYRPTSFWAQATQDIVAEIEACGIDQFRRLRVPLSYFVPTYGYPGNGISADIEARLLAMADTDSKPGQAIEQFVSGRGAALADYHVLLAADDPNKAPCLQTFSESRVGNPVEQFEFDGRRFSRSSLNYLLGLCLLKRHLDEVPLQCILEVGGGFGSLGEIWLGGGELGRRYVDVDIPPNSTITEYYLSEVLGADKVASHASTGDAAAIPIDRLPPASALCNWQIEQLQGTVDLFVNFISFQEMEPAVVQNYLSHVDRLQARWVLLRNMREGKQRRREGSVGVETPITSDRYAAMLPGYDLVDSNVHPFGYRTVDGFHSELLLFKRR